VVDPDSPEEEEGEGGAAPPEVEVGGAMGEAPPKGPSPRLVPELTSYRSSESESEPSSRGSASIPASRRGSALGVDPVPESPAGSMPASPNSKPASPTKAGGANSDCGVPGTPPGDEVPGWLQDAEDIVHGRTPRSSCGSPAQLSRGHSAASEEETAGAAGSPGKRRVIEGV